MAEKPPDIDELIRRARQGDAEALGQLLESYRVHLNALAERHLHGRIGARIGASDVVQQTFLEAHRDFAHFLGVAEAELVAWLSRILEHNLARVRRNHLDVQKRDARREQSLNDPPSGGPAVEEKLRAAQSTPSQRAMRDEEADRLARALATLPDEQRQAVRLRHLEGWPLAAIAQQMNRTPAAVAGLIKRGLQTLRKHLGEMKEE